MLSEDDDFNPWLHRGLGVDEDDGAEQPVCASVDQAIPSSNIGFKLLQKMGWTQGKGLGRKEDGEGAHACVRAPLYAVGR